MKRTKHIPTHNTTEQKCRRRYVQPASKTIRILDKLILMADSETDVPCDPKDGTSDALGKEHGEGGIQVWGSE